VVCRVATKSDSLFAIVGDVCWEWGEGIKVGVVVSSSSVVSVSISPKLEKAQPKRSIRWTLR